ncbi:MAG: c-type cytochrome domain-containing protein [Planctomycetia bacterium]
MVHRTASAVSGRLLFTVSALLLQANTAVLGDTDGIPYSTAVAPILQKYCVGCHHRADAEAGLSLQSPDEILKGDTEGPVLDATDYKNSRLLTVLISQGDDHMPPADQPQPDAAELNILTQWIQNGAKFDSRMAVLPALPKVAVRSANVAIPVSAVFSQSGNQLLTGHFRFARLVSVSNGSVLRQFDLPDGKVNDVQFSRDEKRVLLATGTAGLSGRAVVVDVETSAVVGEYSGHADILYAAVWSPDESIVATAGYDRKIRLHDAVSGKLLRELSGHNGAVFDLQFSPDGTLLASASADATVKIWNVATGERFDTLSQPQAEQYSVVFSPDGNSVYAAGADSRIRQWDLISRTSPHINPLRISRFAHEGAISTLRISSDGRFLITAAENGAVKFWNAAKVEELSAMQLQQDAVSCLAINNAAGSAVLLTRRGVMKNLPLPDLATTSELQPVTMVPASAPPDASALMTLAEAEPNDESAAAPSVTVPTVISGSIHHEGSGSADVDLARIQAKQGQPVLVEVLAARDKSPLDSIVDVLTTDGQPVLQFRLQAVRDSYFTFRGKDSDTIDDFRMFNWQEMELNEYLYADGEVVKLWLYPRGPDSGFKVYPGLGQRQTYFNTTATTHPLQGPAFIVVPFGPRQQLKDTGLPVFPVYSENDDDPLRQWGADSRLMFYPPSDGEYLVRLRDARGFQGADYRYQLKIRYPAPDFSVAMNTTELKIHPGTGREIGFTATRLDGFDGPIEIVAENLPPGFALSDPVIVQDEQRQAFASLLAAADVTPPTEDAVSKIRFVARATINGAVVQHDIGGLKSLALLEKAKIRVRILSDEQHAAASTEHTPELTVWAGETVKAWVQVERLDHSGLVELGKEDAGRNMPHGVFVDNIGLNGLMLLDGQNEREVFITAARWVPEQSRPFYLKSNVDGGITTLPVMLHIRHRPTRETSPAD